MKTERLFFLTKANADIIDITGELRKVVSSWQISDGILFLSVIGSTAALTTMEFEPGLVKDFKQSLESLFPYRADYAHNLTWSDDNGHSHLRSAYLKTSIFVSVSNGALDLGTWQQVVLLDFDTRPRKREVVLKIIE